MAPMYGPITNFKGALFIQPPSNGPEVASPQPYSAAPRGGWLTIKARRNRKRTRLKGAL